VFVTSLFFDAFEQDTVATLLDQLDRCQRALNDFLEEKRSRFPRFYFIGDDDLLEILGQASNPAVIENHLKKLFAGIHSVEFSGDKKSILAMKSEKKEVVPLNTPVRITEEVEQWLQNLAQAMEDTLAALLVKCVGECDYEKYPEQILCLAENVNFTLECEKHMAAGTLAQFEIQLTKQLSTLTGADTSSSKLLQTKLKALILDLIHNTEVVRTLIENQVRDVNDWMWHKQLRFYMKKKDGTGPQLCYIRMADAEFVYTYEYQGNAARLVHTPLTDKCYLTLTQGHSFVFSFSI
jgi:dynein heavy chain 2